MNHQASTWITIRDAAKHIGMSVAFVRKRVHHRTIPFVRIGTKTLRFRRVDLDRWLESSDSGLAPEDACLKELHLPDERWLGAPRE